VISDSNTCGQGSTTSDQDSSSIVTSKSTTNAQDREGIQVTRATVQRVALVTQVQGTLLVRGKASFFSQNVSTGNKEGLKHSADH